MKVLELFSGTGSVGKIFKERNHTVVSLDLKDADINCNILDWDYKKFNPGEFDYIHASPPCDTFSHCRKCYFGRALRAHNPDWSIPDEQKIKFSEEIFQADQLKIGIPILNKTLEIIKYLKPKFYTIENPQTGDMKKYIDLSYNDVTYCKYGFPYRKITRVWHNLEKWKPKPICTPKSICENVVNIDNHIHHHKSCAYKKSTADRRRRHKETVQSIIGGSTRKDERYRIPPELVKEWENAMK